MTDKDEIDVSVEYDPAHSCYRINASTPTYMLSELIPKWKWDVYGDKAAPHFLNNLKIKFQQQLEQIAREQIAHYDEYIQRHGIAAVQPKEDDPLDAAWIQHWRKQRARWQKLNAASTNGITPDLNSIQPDHIA